MAFSIVLSDNKRIFLYPLPIRETCILAKAEAVVAVFTDGFKFHNDIIDKEGVPTGCLPQSANVRFAWSSETNKLSRAYLSGSSNASDRFLVIEGNEYLKDINGNPLNVSGLKPNEQIFADKGNWTYQADVQANTQTKIVLTAKYNEKNQFFFGKARTNDEGEAVLADTENKYHKVRMIYNFQNPPMHLSLHAWRHRSTP